MVQPVEPQSATCLERNIVFGGLWRAGRILFDSRRRPAEVFSRSAGAAPRSSPGAVASSEEDHPAHRVGDHLGGVLLGALLVRPFPGLQPALDVDLPALGEVLAAVLRRLSPP